MYPVEDSPSGPPTNPQGRIDPGTGLLLPESIGGVKLTPNFNTSDPDTWPEELRNPAGRAAVDSFIFAQGGGNNDLLLPGTGDDPTPQPEVDDSRPSIDPRALLALSRIELGQKMVAQQVVNLKAYLVGSGQVGATGQPGPRG